MSSFKIAVPSQVFSSVFITKQHCQRGMQSWLQLLDDKVWHSRGWAVNLCFFFVVGVVTVFWLAGKFSVTLKAGLCLWIVWTRWWEKLTERRAKRTIKSNDTDCTRVRQWLICFLLRLLEQKFSWVHLWDAAECVRLYTHQLILLHYRPSFPFPLADASVWYLCSQWSLNKTEQKKKKQLWYWMTMSTVDFKQMLRSSPPWTANWKHFSYFSKGLSPWCGLFYGKWNKAYKPINE